MAESNQSVPETITFSEADAQLGIKDSTVPMPAFTMNDAMKQLTEYLKHRSTIVKRQISVIQADYGTEPFWAITIKAFGMEPKSLNGRCGFHVYRDGRVELITHRGG